MEQHGPEQTDRPKRLPPEDFYSPDLNAISIVPKAKGRRGGRVELGLDQGTKRLVARVMTLSRGRPCTASDAHLAWWLGASVPSVSRWIAEAKAFGILLVERRGGHRCLRINDAKLAELKARYLVELQKRPRKAYAEDQVDEAENIKSIVAADRSDQTPHQPDGQIKTAVKDREEEENDDGAEPAPEPESSFLRLRRKQQEEQTVREELAEAQERLDALTGELERKGREPEEDRSWRLANKTVTALSVGVANLEEEVFTLGQAAQEEARLQAVEEERRRREAEMNAWRQDPEHRITEDAAMVLDAFQAACRRRFSELSFPERGGQLKCAQEVLDLLRERGLLEEHVLRSWLLWFPGACLNDRSPGYHITIKLLLNSWGRFFNRACPRSLSPAEVRDLVLRLRQDSHPGAVP